MATLQLSFYTFIRISYSVYIENNGNSENKHFEFNLAFEHNALSFDTRERIDNEKCSTVFNNISSKIAILMTFNRACWWHPCMPV